MGEGSAESDFEFTGNLFGFEEEKATVGFESHCLLCIIPHCTGHLNILPLLSHTA